jgi:hypothetical protein
VRLFCLTDFLACLVDVLAPSFLSLRLIRLRRFFIAIESFLVSFFTRLERLDDGRPSLTAIPEGFSTAGLLGPLESFLALASSASFFCLVLSDFPWDLLSDLASDLVSGFDSVFGLAFDSVLGLAFDSVLGLDFDSGLVLELELELLVEDDEELPTLLIVTLLTLRVPVLAVIRIRRVFSSAADII